MDQYLLIQFLGGWTSIYQLFWCSPGVQGFDTLPFHRISMHLLYCESVRLGQSHLVSTGGWLFTAGRQGQWHCAAGVILVVGKATEMDRNAWCILKWPTWCHALSLNLIGRLGLCFEDLWTTYRSSHHLPFIHLIPIDLKWFSDVHWDHKQD